MGYPVEYLELIEVEGQRNLYKASEEIDIGDGEMVGYWEIKSSYGGKIYGRSYIVLPYPSGEWPKEVSVTLLFSSKEYEMLKEMANGEVLEELLKKLINSSAK